MTPAEHDRVAALIASRSTTELDALMSALHVAHHAKPLAHVAVHRAWSRVHRARREYLRAAGHAFVALVVAAPVSLVQRYTGLVVPAFDAGKRM